MDQNELREALIAALRSGKYTQGRHALRKQTAGKGADRYCCLGIACEVMGLLATSPTTIAAGSYTYGEDCKSGYLPHEAQAAFGFHTDGGAPHPDSGIAIHGQSLAIMNDGGTSFPEIADALETGDYWK